ncbi:hypothetical protein R1flu_025073 [Riccia fluitans]|uniref:CAAX amino terminal protease n=1 Tax=Riccia fluitans TaxID=41844 RepID=A0ABD1XZQ2_9MARC
MNSARVFSAADSDDVQLVVQYISKRRPWATIMGIGWGFGANMLSKYLGEEAHATPLTAAVCIDNPYNLEKVTMSGKASRWNDLDKALTMGLVKILNDNKKLFQGGSNGFDVKGGLAAASLREFETAISRVAHGYDSLQNFYEDASSEATLGRVQTPLLCIQHTQDYFEHHVSLSQSAFDKNPYVMLLVSPSGTLPSKETAKSPDYPGLASDWSHGIALEWLTAVEVALLRGRHPLLNVVDLTVKPSKEWSSVGNQIPSMTSTQKVSTTYQEVPSANDMADSEIIDITGHASDLFENSESDTQEESNATLETLEHKGPKNDVVAQGDHSLIDGSVTKLTEDTVNTHIQGEKRNEEDGKSSSVTEEQEHADEEVERGQVQLAAESVMKVLDVTMPGTLSAEQKQQVLEAVGRGETLVGALQEAVPEDVRGKMASAVSAAVQAKGISLKTAGIKELHPPTLPSDFTESLSTKLAGVNGSPRDQPPGSSHSDPGKEHGNDGKKVESVAQSESSAATATTSGEAKGNDAKQDKDAKRGMPEDHKDESKASSDSGVVENDIRKANSDSQGEQQTSAGHEASHSAGINADNLKKDDPVSHTEQTSHEKSEDSGGQRQWADSSSDDHKVQNSGKSQGKSDEKGDSTDPSVGHDPAQSNQGRPAPDSKNNDREGNHAHLTEVKGDAPDQGGGKKTEHEPETTGKGDVPQDKVQIIEQEATPANQSQHNDQSSADSESKPQPAPPSNEETQNSAQDNVPPAANQVPSPDSPQPPDRRQGSSVPSVGQALEALTGFDDATQMAVTNVFGVVENVLDQLENDNPSVSESSRDGGREDKEVTDNSRVPKDMNAHETSDSDLDHVNDSNSDAEQEKKVPSSDEIELKHAARKGNQTGEEEIPQKQASVVVDRQSSKNGDYTHHPELSVSSVNKSKRLPATSALLHEVPNSPAGPGDDSERRLAAVAAEIDQEDEEKERKLSEDYMEDADGKDTNVDEKDGGNVVRDVVLNALKFEVVRRLGTSGLEALGVNLEEEIDKVAHAVSQAVSQAVKQAQEGVLDTVSEMNGGEAGSQLDSSGKLGILNGNIIMQTLGTALGSTSTLGRLVPLGVLVGAVLAGLGAVFLIVSDDEDKRNTDATSSKDSSPDESEDEHGVSDDEYGSDEVDEKKAEKNIDTETDGVQESSSRNGHGATNGKLLNAVAAAVGATASVASQNEASTAIHTDKNLPVASETDRSKEQGSHGFGDENGLPKFVPDIAEKAISMVSPVVPKKDDGQVDQERLVTMLAEIGQNGGALRLVGKAALLWGGLRGAMSLADRLLGFLRIKERPLPQRMLGFLGMALLLWTPVLVPLLPTLLQQWATKSPSGVADAAAGVGLYAAVFILITIWGKRVRDYDRPLVAYGLELLSRAKLGFVAVGMAVGVNLVAAYYGINWALGFISFRWTSLLVENPSFPGVGPVVILTLWKLFSLIGQSVSMAVVVALVEELLFRAWLQEEIAVDLGQHKAILLSAFAFAVVHWSPPATVGLWFLSVALAGARARMDGDLSLPIGIHAGIVAGFSVVNLGGLVYYLPGTPAWLTGAYAGNPLAGAIGTAMVAALAIVLYPRKQDLPHEDDDHYDTGDS